MFRVPLLTSNKEATTKGPLTETVSKILTSALVTCYNLPDVPVGYESESIDGFDFGNPMFKESHTLLLGLENMGISSENFLARKVLQLYKELRDPNTHYTPDLIGEYLMMYALKYVADFTAPIHVVGGKSRENSTQATLFDSIKPSLPAIRDELFMLSYSEPVMELSGEEAAHFDDFVDDINCAISGYYELHEHARIHDTSLLLWDVDYELIDDWGIDKFLYSTAFDALSMRGYGYQYTKEMFTSVDVNIPYFLQKEYDKRMKEAFPQIKDYHEELMNRLNHDMGVEWVRRMDEFYGQAMAQSNDTEAADENGGK